MKKIAVIFLFLGVGVGFFYFKKSFNIQTKDELSKSSLVTLNWSHTPKEISLEDLVEFTFYLKNNKDEAIKEATIDIEATMNHSGMVPIFSKATMGPDFTYKSQFKLTMLGEWILFLTVKLPDGTVIKKEVSFRTK